MGMPIGIDLTEPHDLDVEPAFDWLREVDATFSTYRDDSDISRLARGEILLSECRPEVDEVLTRCLALERETGGFFSVRAGGRLDPSGFVKGWAVDGAAARLAAAGARRFCLNAGGDVVVGGRSPPTAAGGSASATPSTSTRWPRCWRSRTSQSPRRASTSAAPTSATRTPAAPPRACCRSPSSARISRRPTPTRPPRRHGRRRPRVDRDARRLRRDVRHRGPPRADHAGLRAPSRLRGRGSRGSPGNGPGDSRTARRR